MLSNFSDIIDSKLADMQISINENQKIIAERQENSSTLCPMGTN
jgi:hypothetical protein